MIYSPEHGFLFVKTRKTAGTSIEIELSTVAGDASIITPFGSARDEQLRAARGGRPPQNFRATKRIAAWRPRDLTRMLRGDGLPTEKVFWNHMPAQVIQQRLPEAWRTALTFCVVRNPWDVAASRFEMERRRRPEVDSVASLFRDHGVPSNWDLYTIGDKVAVDRVLRYENLEDELASLGAELDLDFRPLPHAKRVGSRDHYRTTLSDDEAQVIADSCAREIEEFGYEY